MSTQLTPPQFSGLPPKERLSALRKWFVILAILGLLAMIYVGYKVFFSNPEPVQQQQQRSSSSFLIPTVYAQVIEQASPTQSVADRRNADRRTEIKQTIMIGIVAVLAILLLVSFGAVFLSTEPNKISVAGDILKTLLGFFIGVATTFFAA
jgi:threonine/homoserine/homoserine lactone efflux protein